MKTVLEPQKEIPVFEEADVIVFGGGPAGIGAALAAKMKSRLRLMRQVLCLWRKSVKRKNPLIMGMNLNPWFQGGNRPFEDLPAMAAEVCHGHLANLFRVKIQMANQTGVW